MRIQSINIAQTRQLETARGLKKTGILKAPVSGPVKIHKLGLEGDYIGNKKLHGGEDQAVYVYSAEDYAWWAKNLGRQVLPGTFGENLTLIGFDSRDCRVGDRLHIGDLVLEISAPRTPCSTLAVRMGNPSFVKHFFKAQRPGAYARVIQEGCVAAGDEILWIKTQQDYVKTLDVFIEWDKKNKSPEILCKALNSPIAQVHREKLQGWYNAINS